MNIYVTKDLWRYTYFRFPHYKPGYWDRVQISPQDLIFHEDIDPEQNESWIELKYYWQKQDSRVLGIVGCEVADRIPYGWGLFVVVGLKKNKEYAIAPRIIENKQGEVELGHPHQIMVFKAIQDQSCKCNYGACGYLDVPDLCYCDQAQKVAKAYHATFTKSTDGIYKVFWLREPNSYIYRSLVKKEELADLDQHPY